MSAEIITTDEFEKFRTEVLSRMDALSRQISDKSSPERLTNKKDTAAHFGCAESTIDNMRRKGIIKAYYVGIGERGKPMFSITEITEALKDSRNG